MATEVGRQLAAQRRASSKNSTSSALIQLATPTSADPPPDNPTPFKILCLNTDRTYTDHRTNKYWFDSMGTEKLDISQCWGA